MRTMTRAEILEAARALPREDLVELANELLELAQGLEDGPPEVAWRAAWGAEAVRMIGTMRTDLNRITVKARRGSR